MGRGGIAKRLIECAMALIGMLPGRWPWLTAVSLCCWCHLDLPMQPRPLCVASCAECKKQGTRYYQRSANGCQRKYRYVDTKSDIAN
ncbi:hypothetical protein [Alishewanella longhuensis]